MLRRSNANRRTCAVCACASTLALGVWGCRGTEEKRSFDPPPCGSFEYARRTLLPGPVDVAYDLELASVARKHDRIFHAISSRATGLNADFSVDMEAPGRRELITRFVETDDGWDLESAVGEPPEAIGVWEKSAGLYAGAGIAADAFRYGTLREGGDDCREIAIARSQLVRGLEGLDVAARIDGASGVIARSLLNERLPAMAHAEPSPLFDAQGMPLPPEKNNGTWRRDQAGRYSDFVWEDSLSRDMLIGWALALAAAWEVVRDDPDVSSDLKRRIQEDARETAASLRVVGESGYDLEIKDADGRLTFHAYLNENAFDRLYVPGVNNGFYAVMALGIVASLAYVAEDPVLDSYLKDELIGRRDLPRLAADEMLEVNIGVGSNFSNFNMAFIGAFLAQRYIEDERVQSFIKVATRDELYSKPGNQRQPSEMKQSFFDFIYAAVMADSSAGAPAALAFDEGAVARGLETLREFPEPPFFETPRKNCDPDEIASRTCMLDDGSVVHLLDEPGRGGVLVALEPIPMRVRPSSNFYWRSNPYIPNGEGSGSRLLPSVDFRVAYWLGRWVE